MGLKSSLSYLLRTLWLSRVIGKCLAHDTNAVSIFIQFAGCDNEHPGNGQIMDSVDIQQIGLSIIKIC